MRPVKRVTGILGLTGARVVAATQILLLEEVVTRKQDNAFVKMVGMVKNVRLVSFLTLFGTIEGKITPPLKINTIKMRSL